MLAGNEIRINFAMAWLVHVCFLVTIPKNRSNNFWCGKINSAKSICNYRMKLPISSNVFMQDVSILLKLLCFVNFFLINSIILLSFGQS